MEVALCHVDEIGVHREPVQVPRTVREFLDAGELAGGETGGPFRVGEVVLRSREVQPECFSGLAELRWAQEPFDEREATLPHFVQGRVGDPHETRPYRGRASTQP